MGQVTTVPKRITPRAAANILVSLGIECTEKKIQRWCKEGRLKRARKVGGEWFIDEQEVRDLVK